MDWTVSECNKAPYCAHRADTWSRWMSWCRFHCGVGPANAVVFSAVVASACSRGVHMDAAEGIYGEPDGDHAGLLLHRFR